MILPSHSQRYLWDGFWNLQDLSGWYLQLEVQNLLSKIRVDWNRWFPEIGVAPTHPFSWDFHRIFHNKDHPAIGVPSFMKTLRFTKIPVQDHDYRVYHIAYVSDVPSTGIWPPIDDHIFLGGSTAIHLHCWWAIQFWLVL